MFGKWQQWIPYTSFNPTICFSRPRTWNIRVDRDPGAWEDCYKTTPHDIPDWSTVRKVGTMIRCQRAVVDGRDGAGINKGSLNKVIDKNEKQHFKDRCEKGQANVGLMWQKAHRNVDVWPIRQPYRRALQINKRHISAKVKSHPMEIMISKLPTRPQELFLFRRWLRWSSVPNHHFQKYLWYTFHQITNGLHISAPSFLTRLTHLVTREHPQPYPMPQPTWNREIVLRIPSERIDGAHEESKLLAIGSSLLGGLENPRWP